jgi:tetratricopeptide (TPR) repeat protein
MSTVMTDVQEAAEMLLEELDCEDEPQETSPPPRVIPSRLPESCEPPAISTPHSRLRVLPRLLAMADTYRQAGSLRQAVEMYFELVREHADTPQALQAEDRLLDVARLYEEIGELRQARGIYEQLL